jgi:hypothetical protein
MVLRSVALAAVLILAPAGGAPASDYSGSSPCGPAVRRFLSIPANLACERVTWQLRVREGAFELDATYGMQAVNAPGFAANPGQARLRGTLTTSGPIASYSRSRVYTLRHDGGRVLDFALIDDDLMHVLDSRKRLLAGDGGWSYTLTREGIKRAVIEPRDLVPAPKLEGAGDFEGRTPCHEISKMLGQSPASGCAKLKWGVTFLADGTYTLKGTLYRVAPRTGTWTLMRDARTGAPVYRLDPSGAGAYLTLLKAGDDVLFFLDGNGNVLAGNSSHGYTLNRK